MARANRTLIGDQSDRDSIMDSVKWESPYRSSEALDSVLNNCIRSSSVMSVTSSIYHFVEENGRTYHKYKEGSKDA